MQQPVMSPRDIDMALAQLDAQEAELERLQEQQQMGPVSPGQASPFQMQGMQRGRPLGSYLLAGAVVLAGVYLFNKSYKVDIRQKRSDKIDELLE